uniref:Uncharacterized protein n=1 Tax=Arundo donax TaxID=35708 RepID=A0A0A9HRY4_ARUDO
MEQFREAEFFTLLERCPTKEMSVCVQVFQQEVCLFVHHSLTGTGNTRSWYW